MTRGSRGFVLLLALSVTGIMMMLAMMLLGQLHGQGKYQGATTRSEHAYYVAEAGLFKALDLLKGPPWNLEEGADNPAVFDLFFQDPDLQGRLVAEDDASVPSELIGWYRLHEDLTLDMDPTDPTAGQYSIYVKDDLDGSDASDLVEGEDANQVILVRALGQYRNIQKMLEANVGTLASGN